MSYFKSSALSTYEAADFVSVEVLCTVILKIKLKLAFDNFIYISQVEKYKAN